MGVCNGYQRIQGIRTYQDGFWECTRVERYVDGFVEWVGDDWVEVGHRGLIAWSMSFSGGEAGGLLFPAAAPMRMGGPMHVVDSDETVFLVWHK